MLTFFGDWDILIWNKGREAVAVKIRKTEYQIGAGGRTVRLALLADLHTGPAEGVVSILRDDPPDLILIAGDLYESPPRNPFDVSAALTLLAGLPAGVSAFYCRGNHDHSPHPGIDRALADAGVAELDSTFRTLDCGITVGGLRSAFYTGGVPDLSFLSSFAALPGYKILISHHPEYYPKYIRALPIDLTVSGHAHGGQWALFRRGLLAPGQGLFPRYTAGVYEGRLAVSRGLSNPVFLPRIGAPCEVVYLSVSFTDGEGAR